MRLSREKVNRISHRVLDVLVAAEDVEFIEDRDTIRQEVIQVMQEILRHEEQLDNEVRQKISSQKKEILEGSEEWDILFRRYYSEGMKRLGIAETSAERA
jgi:uncharacterized protein